MVFTAVMLQTSQYLEAGLIERDQNMAKLYYGHVERDGIKLHYYRTGDEKQPILFLHGITDSGLCWNETALAFEPFYDVILMDARGHGLSDKPESGYGADDRVSDVIALLDQLNLLKLPIVGHSLGAETAALVAARYPERVSSLILEDPPFVKDTSRETKEAKEERAERFKRSILEFSQMSLDEVIEKGRKENPDWLQTEFFQWAKAKKQVSVNVINGVLEKRPYWREYIQAIKCPVLLFTGNNDLGGIITPDVAVDLQTALKQAKIVNIPNAGHNIRRQNFSRFYEEMKAFFRKNYPI